MRNHPYDMPDYGDSFCQTNFDRRTIGYCNPDNLEIYSLNEARKAINILHSGTILEQHDAMLNLINTIEALYNRVYQLEDGIKSFRKFIDLDKSAYEY